MSLDTEFRILGSMPERLIQKCSGKQVEISYYDDLHGCRNSKQTSADALYFIVVQGVSAVVRRCTYNNSDLHLSGYCAVSVRR